MAVRNETITRQFNEEMQAGILEPGEQVVTGMMIQTGASPWFAGLIGVLLMLLTGTRWYYLALTDRRVLFLKASMWTTRPQGGVMWSDARNTISISEVTSDAKVWNWLRYHRPGAAKPIRVNVSAVQWKAEFQTLVAALSADGVPAMPPPPGS